MKKRGTAFLYLLSAIFIIYGFTNFTASILVSLFSLLLGASLLPLAWKLLEKKIKIYKWQRILLPIVLFFITSAVMPNTAKTEVSTPTTTLSVVASQGDSTEASNVSNETTKSADVIEATPLVAPMSEVATTESTTVGDIDPLEVHFIDVGQGDATLIKCGDKSLLIDAGDNSKGTAIQLYLQKQGISKLDYVIGTHHDSDHIGGLDVIITKFDCDTIIMPDDSKDTNTYRDVISAMDYKRYRNTTPVPGTKYQFGDAEFTLLQAKDYGNDSNNSSVGIILTHGEKKFLFTGDAEEPAEIDIVQSGIDITCDVYQVGHHGSNSSSSNMLLEAAKPTFAVISCGEGNSYGHPRAETLNNFRARGINVFRTDEQGTLVATSDGKEITWNSSPSESWIAGEPTGGSQTQASETQNTTTVAETAAQQDSVTYVLNTSSKKFHETTCNSLPDTNRKDSKSSRDEIISQGYVPCKRCNP